MDRLFVAALTGLVAMSAAVTGAAGSEPPSGTPRGDPLGAHRWRSRVLVISAVDAGDRNLVDQRAVLATARSGLGERDLVTVEAIGGGAPARALRRHLGLPDDAFRAVLVGKDGAAKIVSGAPIPVDRLFATIDAMPMRRNEIERRR